MIKIRPTHRYRLFNEALEVRLLENTTQSQIGD